MSEPDKTLAEFLAQKRISKAFYYDLKKRGLGANETTYPGSRVIRISAAAEQAFDERMAEYAKSEAAKLEAERRSAQAAEAGRIAAQAQSMSAGAVNSRSRNRGGNVREASKSAAGSGF